MWVVPPYAVALVVVTCIDGCCKARTGAIGRTAGTLTVDGQSHAASGCDNIQGPEGVELKLESEARIRVVKEIDGRKSVYYFAPREPTAANLGDCVELNLTIESSRHGRRDTRGSAKFDCSSAGHTIVGAVDFESCGSEIVELGPGREAGGWTN